MARPAFKSVSEYLAAHPADHRSVLTQVRAVIRKLRDRVHSKTSLHFAYTEEVPVKLITRIAKIRAAEATARATSKKTKPAPKRRSAAELRRSK